MKLTCPVCQSKYSVSDVATTNVALLKEMVDLAARFGSAWKLAEEYVESFRVSQYSSVGIKKKIRLLQETVKLWEGCEFQYKGRRYRSDRGQIKEALNIVCNKELVDNKNHNYLYAVLCNTAQRVSAEGMTAREEEAREQGRRPKVEGRRLDEDEPMSTQEFQKRLGALAEKIGGKVEG